MTVRYTLTAPAETAQRELTIAQLWAAGALGVWERRGELVAWFDAQVPSVPGRGRWEDEPDHDWQADWKAGIGPVVAGAIAVVPSWLRDEAPRAAHTIELDPGQAFGTGHHATTALCLELLQDVGVAGARVLDVGTGTGVLAIAAALLGAAEVHAVDLDGDAIAVARDNAARNAATDIAFTTGSITADHTGYDLVLGNLLTDTVTQLAPRLVGACVPGGTTIASGITVERAAGPRRALTAAGGTVQRQEERDGWVGLVVGRQP